MTPDGIEVCLVGAGPRGLSVLERLCARERRAPSATSVLVHLVDPAEPGAGAVWRTDQSRHLLMNTVAAQITVWTDASVTLDGPVEPGPSLWEWAGGPVPPGTEDDPAARAEAAALGPDTYPTRALYGRYLRHALVRVLDRAPAHVTVRRHRTRAVALPPAGDEAPQEVLLADGTRLTGLHAVVLAQGHVPAHPTPAQRRTARLAAAHGLLHIPPANPADLDLRALRPGRPVLLRGLGLAFFDLLTLLTAGRGGTFHRTGERLVYHPCGEEPVLWGTSRRGVPYHARGANEKGPHARHQPLLLTPDRIAVLRERAARGERVGFRADIWPLVSKEVRTVYYAALLAERDRTAPREEFTAAFLAASLTEEERLLDALRIAPADRWDWARLAAPAHGLAFPDRESFRRWLLGHLRRDIAAARAGNVHGPLKAALDVLRDLRNEIRLAVDHAGIEGDSYHADLDNWYTPLNAYLSIGPPLSRIEEAHALVEAGILHLVGPDPRVGLDARTPAFTAASAHVPGPVVRADVLIEARLPTPDVRRTADPLLRDLLDTGQAAVYRIPRATGGSYETGGLAVTPRPNRLIGRTGHAHARRFAYGVPTESVHWATAAGIRPGVDSVTLGDSDAIARAVLALPRPYAPAPGAGHPGLTVPREVTA